MTRLSKRIADRLRAARIEADLTQQQLASKAGVSIVHVSRLERHIADQPRRVELEKVARALGLSADDLMGIEDDDESDDDPDSADNFRAELARRYGHETAAFVDEVATKIKDFPARDAALVRLLLLGAVRAADPRPRGSPDGMSETASLARAH